MAENPPPNQSGRVYDDDHEFPLAGDHPASSPTIQQLRQGEGIGNTSSTAAGTSHGGSTSSTSAGGGGSSTGTSSTGGGASSTTGGDGGGSTASTQGNTPVSTSDLADRESSSGLYNPNASSTGGVNPRNVKSFFWGSSSRRRKTIIGGVGGVLVGGGLFGLTIVSGPLQFVHFAQLLQHWHLSNNETFGDSRASRIMLNALSNKGVESTRLGILGNKAANIWEQKLLDSTGLKPVYSAITGRFVGFAIMDENKTFDSLLNASDRNDRTSANIENVMGKGAEITTAGEASAVGQGIVFGGSEGKVPVPKDIKLISLTNVSSLGERAKFIRSIGTLTDTSKLVSSIGSRLLVKRAGVDFHPLKNIERKATDKLADYIAERRKATAEEESTGTFGETLGHNTATDNSGKPVETSIESSSTDSANSAITKVESSVGTDVAEEEAAGLGPGAVVGVICAAKSIGDNVPKFKYINDVLPMIRMGMTAITIGNQVMSGQGVNMNELGAEAKAFDNPKDGTSWTNAKSVQAQLGEPQTGPDLPPEAQLKNVGSKPKFFSALDNPALSATCTVNSGIGGILGGIPIIGSIVNAGEGLVTDALNGIAGLFGTSLNGIIADALRAAAGKTVNTLAQGAEYGGLADTGAFLAGDQNAITMGGAPLTNGQVGALNAQQTIADSGTKQSFSQRYLDPYNNNSLVGSLINSIPPTSDALSSVSNSVASFFSGGFGKLLGNLMPKAHAATSAPYDYGIPQYGFSVDDQNNPAVEDPYANAAVIEQPGVLDTLNQEYGQLCFGMTVTDTSSGVSVQTEAVGSDDTNMIAVEQNHADKCDPSINKDPMFLRYRFYLADSVAAESMACDEADDAQSCTDLGMDSSGSSATAPVAGDATQLAQQILNNKNIDLSYNASVLQDVQDAANGQVGTAGAMTSAAILKLIATVGQSHSVKITAIQSNGQGHCNNTPKSGCPGDPHYNGDAVDFGALDGTIITGRNAPALTIINIAEQVLPSGTRFGQHADPTTGTLCGPVITLPTGFTQIDDTCDHLHIDVPLGTP